MMTTVSARPSSPPQLRPALPPQPFQAPQSSSRKLWAVSMPPKGPVLGWGWLKVLSFVHGQQLLCADSPGNSWGPTAGQASLPDGSPPGQLLCPP